MYTFTARAAFMAVARTRILPAACAFAAAAAGAVRVPFSDRFTAAHSSGSIMPYVPPFRL